MPLLFNPGDRRDYGIGIGIGRAGKMVEAASGQKLGHDMTENTFEQLGTDDMTFRLRPAIQQRIVTILSASSPT